MAVFLENYKKGRLADKEAKRKYLSRKEFFMRLVNQEKERLAKNQFYDVLENSFISLNHVNKIYEREYVHAVHDFSLQINKGEFIVLVGPSGCGKSTTLRMIAGLENITSGDLFINGHFSNYVPPKDRNMAMVFQSYALYPHLSVYNNMAFSLKLRHFDKEEIYQRVKKAAKILELGDYLDRKPKELSGGQRQRVALGRAIVRNADIFLMDEPLSNLDAKLRVQMRSEIIRIHKALGATTIYVTHDQVEAMTMADRIVIMKDGYIQQTGTPEEIYLNPANAFVATFIGSPCMNLCPIEMSDDKYELNGQSFQLDKEMRERIEIFYQDYEKELLEQIKNEKDSLKSAYEKDPKAKKHDTLNEELTSVVLESLHQAYDLLKDFQKKAKKPYSLGIRPEDIVISSKPSLETLTSTIENIEMMGQEYFIYFSVNDKQFVTKVPLEIKLNRGEKIYFKFKSQRVFFFDALTQKKI